MREKNSRMLKRCGVIFIFIILITGIFLYKYSVNLLQRKRLPRVAVVLDDWGYNLNNMEILRSIDIPLTLAILPNLKYSKDVAKETKLKNRQIILHMPMEPTSARKRLEKHTALTGMDAQKIASIFDRALESVPGVKGVSNHMGSKFTADSKSMDIFFKLLKKKKLFFLDNISTKDSVCDVAASANRVKLAERDIYLDNLSDTKYIKGQIQKLIEVAERQGYAEGTGHDRINTLMAIKEAIPELKNKVKFVFVSELAK